MAAPLDRSKLVVPSLLALAAIALVGPWHVEGSGGRTASGVAAAAILAAFGLTCWGVGRSGARVEPEPAEAPGWGPLLDRLDRIAVALESRPATPAGTVDGLATMAEAIAEGRWADAEAMLARHPDHPRAADYAGEIASAKRIKGLALRGEIEAAQAVNDPGRVLQIHEGLAAVLTPEALGEIEPQIVKWFTSLIMRRLRGGTVRPDVAELAARVAERFPRSVEGASLRASLGTLRRSAGLCPRCARPYRGIADACPLCLAGPPGPGGEPAGAAWKVEPPADEERPAEPSPDGLPYPEFLDDPT